MSDNQFSQGWGKVRQPLSFDVLDFDYSWMADDSLVEALQDGRNDVPGSRNVPKTKLREALNISDFSLATPFSSNGHGAQEINSFHDNEVPDGYAQPAANDSNISTHKPYICAQCPAAYRRFGDLTRHQKEKHSAASSKYLCPIGLCPRGIAGEGFGRMHHLVAHLKSGRHGMDGREAAYLARQHNLPKGKGAEIGREGGLEVL